MADDVESASSIVAQPERVTRTHAGVHECKALFCA